MATQRISWKARWLFTGAKPPIENGWMTVGPDGVVEEIGAGSPKTTNESHVRDLGNVAIIPALVNAHTHLEFSNLKQPVPQNADSFADWIRAVLAHRSTSDDAHHSKDPIALGLEESRAAGVRIVGEIATQQECSPALPASPIGGVRFFELIGISPERRNECLSLGRTFLSKSNVPVRWQHGLSPHAPYTTSLELVEQAVALANEFQAPIAMHLAETKEELELLDAHSGPLRTLLDERSLFDPQAFPTGTRALDYLRLLAQANRCFVIHGNFLTTQELQFMAKHADRMTLVYCPRTHSYFGHAPYPLEEAIRLGVDIALGTDSRASNPDLSLLEECKHAAVKHPETAAHALLKAATNGMPFHLPTDIAVGQVANVSFVMLPATKTERDPFRLLLAPDSQPFQPIP